MQRSIREDSPTFLIFEIAGGKRISQHLSGRERRLIHVARIKAAAKDVEAKKKGQPGSFSLARREIVLLDSLQLEHPPPAPVESLLSRFCRRFKFCCASACRFQSASLFKNF
jgi:hypothetical protein